MADARKRPSASSNPPKNAAATAFVRSTCPSGNTVANHEDREKSRAILKRTETATTSRLKCDKSSPSSAITSSNRSEQLVQTKSASPHCTQAQTQAQESSMQRTQAQERNGEP
eukprot:CAMPEP_0204370106 /NCGR_PEP_ID=MMETSP0469-20131031/45489_1 /ASSEMBLY_ACC=CAM_ASM_000384 /TAXON_ID=2969 /ORGANISM="Oxyrrhis marina" /LENGTH=112 /DNA_ID=CAMNT_0051359981 /DNA_START=269 /DNA_END=604 /DNA_ORIENTATION=-